MLPKVRSEECGVRSCGAALLRFIKRNDLPITSSYLLAFFCLPFQNMREAHTTTPHFYLLISHSSILPAYSLFQIIRRKADTATPHFSLLTPTPRFYLLISHSSILPAYSLFQIIRRKADTATPHFSLLTPTPRFYLLISHSSILPAYSLFQIIRRKADTATPHFSLLTPNSINTSSRLLSPSSIIFVRFCSHVTRFRQYVQMNQQNLALLPKRKKALAFFAKL